MKSQVYGTLGQNIFANRVVFLSAVDWCSGSVRRKGATEMARIFSQVDLLLVPSMRDETLTHREFQRPPLASTLRGGGLVEVSKARSDWAACASKPLPVSLPAPAYTHGVT